jgi:uncharacterized protein involved in cysteine biosynthesis
MQVFAPVARAIAQFDDPVFLGVLARSVVYAALSFVAVLAGVDWALTHFLSLPGWAAGLLASLGAALLAFFLFQPVAVTIGAFYSDRVAAAVERRWYPALPGAAGASLAIQAWDGIALGLRVLVLSLIGLVLTLALPGIGFVLGWLIAAWALGRGLFMAAAMRRMPRPVALVLYSRKRLAVLGIGVLLAAMGFVPLINLLVPVFGIACMVHLLHGRADSRFGNS